MVDATELTGKYDFKLVLRSYGSDGPAAGVQNAGDPGDNVYDALDLLGLRVESFNGPVNFVVIDSIRKEPTPN